MSRIPGTPRAPRGGRSLSTWKLRKKQGLDDGTNGNDCPCWEIIFAQSAGLLLKANQIRLARQVHIYKSVSKLRNDPARGLCTC
jgi:hypothetical protein